MILPLAALSDAVTGLLTSLISLASLLLLVYVLLDLARSFMRDVPPMVTTFHEALGRLWEPILRPIRNALPAMGGIDFSPLIVILLLQFVATLIR